MTPIPDITKHVYREHIARYGEPDLALMYDKTTAPAGRALPLEQVLVMCWRPDEDVGITTFATVGMSSRLVPGTPVRLELHFSIEGHVEERVERAATRFLANMANYPWDHQRALDWWHTLVNPGPIPGFPHCSSILFHPRFTPDGWDHLHFEDKVVHILNAVPITERERSLVASSRQDLLDYWSDSDVWIFSDRTL